MIGFFGLNSLGWDMHWVYIIYSEKIDKYYIGETSNISDRMHRHNQDRNKFTRGKGPWKLVWLVERQNRLAGKKLEQKLKRMKNSKKAIEHLSGNYKNMVEHSDF